MTHIKITLTTAAQEKIQTLIASTSLRSTRDVFQKALSLLVIYDNAMQANNQLRIVNPRDSSEITVIDLGIH